MGSVRSAGLAALVVAIASCGGRTLSLGDKNPRRYHFDPPQIVAELASNARTDNPTLTADLLEIYFTTDRVSGNGDVWVARRNDPELPFDPPTAVTEVNSAAFETSAAISADGLTLWFGSDRVGSVGTDIWMSNRPNRSAAWPTPVNVVALNTAAEDIPRPPGQHGLVMPLSSKAGTTTDYRTFLATRPSTGALFRMPVLVSELVYPDRSTVDGFLTDDGLTMFFSSSPFQFPPDAGPRPGDAGSTVDGGPSPSADLYVAWRQAVDAPFSATQPLDDLNTGGDERDPWLTPDGKTLYFTSDRDGALTIYTATVKPR
jgi:WD40-like Beta Propeller Repeat